MRAFQLLFIIFLAFPQIANSALTSADLVDPAGTLIVGGVTRDSNTGLEWVDIPITQGNIVSPQSVDAILASGGPGVGWVNDGWRIANSAEVCLLFATYAGTAPICPDGGFGVLATPADSTAFQGFFGITDVVGMNTRGLFDDASLGSSGIAVISSVGFINISSNARPSNVPWVDAGVFLVRSVPVGVPVISISPNPIELGNVDLFSSNSVFVTISNIGTADLLVNSVEIPGIFNDQGGPNEFSLFGIPRIPESPPPFPALIPPGFSMPVWGGVAFNPTVLGTVTAALTVSSNDPSAPFQFVLIRGTGVEPPIVIECNGLAATIVGTENGELIIGTTGDDVIAGRGGNDFIRGRGGNDVICGDSGDDVILGNGGDDLLFGNGGDDTIKGGPGVDVLSGNDGSDVLFGGADNDVLNGDDGLDRLFGGDGEDLLNGDLGNDALFGGGGIDTIDGGDGNDICNDTDFDIVVNCELTRN